MSGKEGVLVHYGAALGNVTAGNLLEFFLIAEIKGEIATDQDNDTISQISLRASGQHAFSTDPEVRDVGRALLNIWDLEPDDRAMVKLLDGWREDYIGRALYSLASVVAGPASRWSG